MNIYFLKTPLDSSYRNVIDFIHYDGASRSLNYNDRLGALLRQQYGFDDLSVPDDRAFKRSVDMTSITVPYSYDRIRDANYILILKNNRYYYYFVNNIVSNNDSDTNPSCTLTLKWDAWNNNIEKIMRNTSYNTVQMCHYDRFGGIDTDNKIKPRWVKCNKQNVPTVKNDYVQSTSRYIPVFRVFQVTNFPDSNDVKAQSDFANFFSNSVQIGNSGNDDISYGTIVVNDSLCGKYDRNVVYSLVGIFDALTNSYVEGVSATSSIETVKCQVNNDYRDVKIYPRSINLGEGVPEDWYIKESLREYIESSYLTFQCPFLYEYDETSKIITFTKNPILPQRTDVWGKRGGFGTCTILGDFFMYAGSGYDFPSSPSYKSTKLDIIDSNFYEYTGTEYYNYLADKYYFKKDSPYEKRLDPQGHQYPYDYLSIVYGNNEIIMEPMSEFDLGFRISKSVKTAQTQFYISSNNERILSPTNFFVDMPTPYSLGRIAETSYMVRNGVQLDTARTINKIYLASEYLNLGAYAGSKLATDPISLFSSKGIKKINHSLEKIGSLWAEELRRNAFEKDLANTPGTWFASAGECDRFYQDRIRVVRNKVQSDNVSYNEYLDLIYYYGYERTHNINILDNTRIKFDYCQTMGCDLCDLKLNDDDRQELEAAFDRGLTKWHILYDVNANKVVTFTSPTKDKSILGNNIEHKFETNPTFRNWVNS